MRFSTTFIATIFLAIASSSAASVLVPVPSDKRPIRFMALPVPSSTMLRQPTTPYMDSCLRASRGQAQLPFDSNWIELTQAFVRLCRLTRPSSLGWSELHNNRRTLMDPWRVPSRRDGWGYGMRKIAPVLCSFTTSICTIPVYKVLRPITLLK
ncbi:hypothetical protein LXA43DRAFT_662983 [Ganoderma leucocontextum]|nr:hypothetical protein LXA43DRAFT_662983 [Ganoderma leucocontextum]